MELITKMHLIAKKRGGTCLSNQYINSKKKLLWKCKEGHQWFSTPFSIIIRKSWCPQCAGNQPLGMDVMYKLAKENGGKCLSSKYGNCKKKMLWECKNKHQFQSAPDSVKQGKWCPICYKINSKT